MKEKVFSHTQQAFNIRPKSGTSRNHKEVANSILSQDNLKNLSAANGDAGVMNVKEFIKDTIDHKNEEITSNRRIL